VDFVRSVRIDAHDLQLRRTHEHSVASPTPAPGPLMLGTSGKQGDDARPVGSFAQSFSESVTSGKLKGSHLFASVIHASRKRA
jgi:hypothetical protein